MDNNTKGAYTLEVCRHLYGALYPVEREYSGSVSDLLEQAQDFGLYSNNPEFCYYVVFPDGLSTARIVSYQALLSILQEEVDLWKESNQI